MKHRIWFKALALMAVLTIVATACASDDDGGDGASGGDVDCATVEFGCVEVGADEPITLGAAQVISGADAVARPGPGQRARAVARLPGRDVRSDERNAPGPPGRAHGRGRAVLGRRRAGGGHRARCRHVDRRRGGDELFERRTGRRGHDPRRQGHHADLRIEHQPRADGPGAAQPVLRPHRAQRPDPGRDRRRVRARARTSARPRRRRSPTRAPTPRDSWARSRRTSRPGGGTLTGSEQVDSEDTDFKPVLRSLAEQRSGRPVLPDLRGSMHADHQAGAGHHARRRADRG